MPDVPEQQDLWLEVKESMHAPTVNFGRHVSYWFRHSPRRLLHAMSYYKFAARLIGSEKKVLEVGCAEGLGTWLLAKECGHAVGLDVDPEALVSARRNFGSGECSFAEGDFLALEPRTYDAVVSLDVIEHLPGEEAAEFLDQVGRHLTHDGIAVIGSPNIEAQKYASPIFRAEYVNYYDHVRLKSEIARRFHHVFLFGANDEMVHTGFPPMAHYFIALGCRKRC